MDAYVHAMLGSYPRARYVVGMDAKMTIILQAFPEWMSDWVLRKLMGKTPVPAALLKKSG